MANDVTLVLKANNSDHINKMKEAQKETQKVYDTAEKGSKREKGILEEIDATLVRLQKARQKAFSYEEIEKYNKKIQEAKQHLQEYEQAGLKQEKQTESMTQSMTKWALSIGGVAAGLKILKDAAMKLIPVINLYNIGLAVINKVLENIVTGQSDWNKGIVEAIRIQRVFNDLRVEEYKESYLVQKLKTEFQRKWNESLDGELTRKEKIIIIDEALLANNKAIDIEMEHAIKIRDLNYAKLVSGQGNEEQYKAYWDAMKKIEALDAERFTSTKRLTRQRETLEIEVQKERVKAWHKEIEEQNKVNEIKWKQEDELLKKEGDANKEYYMQSRDDFFNYIDRLNKAKEDAWNFELEIGKKNFTAERARAKLIYDARIDDAKKLADAEEKVAKAKQENLAAAGQAVLDYISIIDELAQREVDEAQRQRELYDTRIDEAQSALETEAELFKTGYASNVAAKQKELDELKKARDKALLDEEKALKKAHSLKVAQLVAEQATAMAKVIMSAEVAKMEARAMINNPITAIPGIALLASVRISEAISIAAIIASVIAASMSKFAKGGWTGEGSQRDSTGERMAGIVHEREFVVKKGPANRYREVLEAINRDDRKMIFNSFNKISPEVLGTTVNNVVVENSGSNSRLDKLILENKKLNEKLSGESVQDYGKIQVIRKGNVTRTIRK